MPDHLQVKMKQLMLEVICNKQQCRYKNNHNRSCKNLQRLLSFLSQKCFKYFIPVYCLQPPTIEHARHSALPEQATFDLDATVQYNCHTGYATNGFPRAKCLAIDGQASWYGPDITCERK